jgi:acetylglutamate kinase
VTSEGKPEFLNAADKMRNGVAIHITDIRPDTNIESEIFPKELTREAQNKDVFTPPNH